MTGAAIVILGLVTAQRIAELVVSNRNRRRLVAAGAREHGRGHYPALVGLHAAWLASLWWLAPGRDILIWPIVLFLALQVTRVWVIASLEGRWTTRIIVLPGAPLVRRGPYRLLRHPNYAIVVAEIALLPLAFGLVGTALIFSLLNAAVLTVRIRAENRALESAAAGS